MCIRDRNEADIKHFQQSLADRGTIAEISTGNDDVVGRLPLELLQQFDGKSFLSLQPKRVDGVQLIDRSAFDKFLKQSEAAIEVSAELAGQGAIVERLR